MKSVVELDVSVPQRRLSELFLNSELSTEWMDDVERYEAISSEPGMPGSKYRLVPKSGSMVFVATVISRSLPSEASLQLDTSSVTVSVTGRFVPLSPDRTRLLSEEVFRFKGLYNKLLCYLARGAITKAHRRHMEAFKRFAKSRVGA
jgi:hypothetical protein